MNSVYIPLRMANLQFSIFNLQFARSAFPAWTLPPERGSTPLPWGSARGKE